MPIGGLEIRNRIRKLRFECGEMTQQELADRVGVSRQTVNAIEGGKYSPSLEVAYRIARVFERSIESVFEFVESNPAPG
ncbi:MAG: helix-turn-helix transcriptional regulator [Isosphaeraceae bacterium]|nr:helix-turn-helix transcriptional regulator [Isosphaeraceae bacterium]